MSVARDFQTRDRAPTAASYASAPSVSGLPRRGSTMSRNSTLSANDQGLHFRHPSRSNTVTTYHQTSRDHPIWQPGAEPGIDTAAADELVPEVANSLKAKCDIRIIDFSDTDFHPSEADNDSLAELLDRPRPDDLPCRWISVNQLSWDVIKCLGNKYNLHPLAVEDLIHTRTRTKVDWYADHAFVVLTLQKLVKLHQHRHHSEKCDCPGKADSDDELDEKPDSSPPKRWWQREPKRKQMSDLPYYLDRNQDGKIDEFVNAHSGTSEETPIKPLRTLHRYESSQVPEHTVFMEKHSVLAAEEFAVSVEQVSIFLMADNTVISFFEQSAEDIEKLILPRLSQKETMLRRSCDASLVLQSIIDAIVDLAIPIKDAYNTSRKELQVDAMISPDIRTSRALHIFGEEIDMLQNLFKPIVHLVNALRDHNSDPLHATAPPIAPPPSDPPKPAKPELPKNGINRDRGGTPAFDRQISGFKRATLKRANTATTVSITPLAHTYFGDVLDHCITIIQTLEQMDASAGNMSTLIFNTVGAKTNNFMMILAVVTVFFAPLTFISGYFGMNFSMGNGLDHPFAFFWIVAAPSLVGFMLLVFATMLWEHITDAFAKRDVRSNRVKRNATKHIRR